MRRGTLSLVRKTLSGESSITLHERGKEEMSTQEEIDVRYGGQTATGWHLFSAFVADSEYGEWLESFRCDGTLNEAKSGAAEYFSKWGKAVLA